MNSEGNLSTNGTNSQEAQGSPVQHDYHATDEPLVRFLTKVIHWAVRALAILMTGVIILGVVDVVYVIYEKMTEPPYMLLTINDILATFGAFMAVLIAVEIFINITVYLREDVIHVKIVIATALMAIARKVIILDIDKTTWEYVFAIAAVVLALSIAYWLVVVMDKPSPSRKEGAQGH